MVYEDRTFFDLCDELGNPVWQDCMLANLEPPDDPEFLQSLEVELHQVFGSLQGRPSLAVVSGAARSRSKRGHGWSRASALGPERLGSPRPRGAHQGAAGRALGDATPTGGDLPFQPDTGIAHYFGVGAYLRPLDDARRRGKFRCRVLGVRRPPTLGPSTSAWADGRGRHHPLWKAGVPRDAGTGWDFEDVRDHYVHHLYGVEVLACATWIRAAILDLGRAAVAA